MLVRESLLAQIVSYLRAGATTADDFSLDPAVPDKYPFAPVKIFTFTLNDEIWQITHAEQNQEPLTPGVTIECGLDRAATSKALPQPWEMTVRFRIRVPRDWNGEGTAEEIAQKIDEALYRAGGKIPIADYQQDPAAATGHFIEYITTPRGEWEWVNAGVPERRLTMTMRYALAEGAGF